MRLKSNRQGRHFQGQMGTRTKSKSLIQKENQNTEGEKKKKKSTEGKQSICSTLNKQSRFE